MTAKEILEWLELEQGTATKSDIRRVWHSLPPEGMGEGEVDAKFIRIGCKVPEVKKI